MNGEEENNTQGLEERMREITNRTGYSYEVTVGQRKYGGPPPDWNAAVPGSGCEIYVGKIPKFINEDELIPLFEQYGYIYDMRIMLDTTAGTHRGFCFCLFSDKNEASEAAKQLDGYEIRPGKKLKCNISIPNVRLFVGNIPKSKSKDELFEEFSTKADGLVDVIVYSTPDDEHQKNRGFCFLDYETHKAAAEARKRLQTRPKVFNCNVITDWAEPQKEPDSETMAKVKVLYVNNLKADVTEEMLRETFAAYGEIEKVKRIKDYGFVHFVERENAISAMEALNGTMISDSEMSVSLAKPPSIDHRGKEARRQNQLQGFGGGRGGGRGMGMGGGRGRGMRGMMGMGGGFGRGRGGASVLGSLGRGRGRGLRGALAASLAAAAAASYDYYGGYDDGSYYDESYYDGSYDYTGEDYSGYEDYSGFGFGGMGMGVGAGMGRGAGRGGRGRGGGMSMLGSLGGRGGGRGGARGKRGAPGCGRGLAGAPRGRGGPAKRKAGVEGAQPQAKMMKMDQSEQQDYGGNGEEAWYQDTFAGSQQWG